MKNLPQKVSENIKFLKSKKVWCNLSLNPHVKSCSDAANNRKRLGNTGIPIFDELKSELGFYIDKNNKKQKVLVHCRGNQKLDRLKISGILNSEYQRTTSEKESKGLINPFGRQFRNLLQIFDISTTMDFHPPCTMMTNAGDYNYALEFEINPLISVLENTLVEDIIRVDNYKGYIKHKIGILTGNSPDSGMLLWEKINSSIKSNLISKLNHSFRGDLSYPEIVVSSVPNMGISMELDKRFDATEKIVIKSTIDLCQNGISILCIACNTTQYYKNKIDEVCSLYNVKFISIPEVINNYLEENKISEFDFLGISHVVDFENLSAFKDLRKKYEIEIPNKQALKKINEIAFTAKKDINKAVNLLRDLVKNDTKYSTVIVVLTEISTILAKHKKIVKDKTIIDSLQLLADFISDTYVKGIFETLYIDKDKDSLSFELLKENDKAKVKSELWNILKEVDYEFIPPLSYRDSTTFSFDSKTSNHVVPESYFKKMLTQEIIISKKKCCNSIVGFMSYISNYKIDEKNIKLNCYYISTIGVTKGARGNGITVSFYKMLEDIVVKGNFKKTIATRTWSTNQTHIKILQSLGYKQIIELKDDRAAGINTVYYAKEL